MDYSQGTSPTVTGTSFGMPLPQGQVDARLATLDSTVSELQAIVSSLHDRLSPVLAPIAPSLTPEDNLNVVQPQHSALTHRIAGINAAVVDEVKTIHALLERIEI